jgi:uncharacterized Fe-S cluster protein YjdI
MILHDRAAVVLDVRHDVMIAADAAHTYDFVRGKPRLRALPDAVWINPPATDPEAA